MTGYATVPVGDIYARLHANISRVVQGKPDVIRQAVVTLLAGGHLLIEDVPGLGKTTLARCIAKSVSAQVNRIQFTPDLLPGDITGSSIYHQDTSEMRFHRGAIFANVVIADEINRGTPKTQSALLEVMAEGTITADGVRYPVPQPFMVVATQNPIELEGTYRLPEAQLDRFLMRISVGHPDVRSEVQIVLGDTAGTDPSVLPAVLDLDTLQAAINTVRALPVHQEVVAYAVRLTAATRVHPAVRYGASPRGSIALVRAARGWAATGGRSYVTPDDVKDVAHAVLDHRVILTPDAELNRTSSADIVTEILTSTMAPGASAGRAGY